MSSEIFDRIPGWLKEKSAASIPAFFYRTCDGWEEAGATDLQSFHGQMQSLRPYATVLLTSYAIGQKTMIVAHYESPTEACHQVWTCGPDGSLAQVFRSPVESTEFAKAA